MQKAKKSVVIGFIGTVLDMAGTKPERWARWRPTLCLCQQESLVVDRLELLIQGRSARLAEQIIADIATVSPETEVRTRVLELKDPWEFEEVYGALHDFARAYPFDTEHEDYLIHITTGTHVAQICLFLLAESRHLPGRLVQSSPPAKGENGPGELRIIDLDLSRYDRLASRFRREQEEAAAHLKSGINTRNRVFNALIERVETVAMRSRDPILLMGPTGAGKSHLARRIFEIKRARRRVGGEFVELNCATLRGDAAMSALFGHVKGAFTGAQRDRPGLLRAADGGVLFLDEIGELGADEQAMLLRALEEKRFLPVGADREATSDFQLIAGTNRDLRAEVRAGRFREDLLARIDLWTFQLPGLRERREDIEPNLEFELERFAREHGARVGFSREARTRYLEFARSPAASWNGNFRDLNASLTRLATLAEGGRITEPLVSEEIERLRSAWSGGGAAAASSSAVDGLLRRHGLERLDRFDEVQLREVLAVCLASASLSEAGRRLFAVSREQKSSQNDADRLRKYLARFGLGWGALRAAGGDGS